MTTTLLKTETFRSPQPPNELFQGLAVALPICIAGWAVIAAFLLWVLL
jgi:hypothetical protein